MADSHSTALASKAVSQVSAWLTHIGVSPAAFDDTISLISPLLSVHRLRAQVVSKQSETPGAVTLVLQTGGAFQGLKPGQFVLVAVIIDGARHLRAYSPRSIDGRTDRIAITVQRQPDGLVSKHLNDHTRPGDFLEIAQAAGNFVLPGTLPAEVLLMAGGSGITPCMAMLQHLHRTAPRTQATLIYFARSRQDRIFAKELDDLARQWPQLRYVPIDSVANTPDTSSTQNAAAPQPMLDAELLTRTAAKWAQVPAYCCGPAPLMDAAKQLWREAGVSKQLRLEAFAPSKPTGDAHAVHQVHLERQHQTRRFIAKGDQSILVAGEAAGMTLKHGCRQGICHECTCRLRSGSVRDLTSGERIDGEGQAIRLCVSTAMSDLSLESLS